jgi:hypothetical protein
MTNSHRWLLLVSCLSVSVAIPVGLASASEGCSAYPLSDGLTVQQTERGPKIVSTATVSVAMDDQEEVLDAIKEAELTAKAAIAKFFSETIQSDESLDKAVETNIKIVGDQKEATKTTLKKQMSSIRNSASALLKGVQKIGDCYTSGDFVRVTVGLKPESVAAAASGQEMIQNSGEASESDSGSSGSDLNPTESFSNTKGLQEF